MRPTWAEISLTALLHNYATIRDWVAPNATVCAVVKADAYGHGAVECARAMEIEGATWFGVTCPEEGVKLRQGGITSRILLMSGFWRGDESAVVEHDLTPAIWSWEHIEALENAVTNFRHGRPVKEDHPFPVHLKIDTGMHRLGADVSELPVLFEALHSAKNVSLEGVMTHIASAEVFDAPQNFAQSEKFEEAVAKVREAGFHPIYLHSANGAALASRSETWMNMVRPGLSLYGYYLPFTSVVTHAPDASMELDIKPVLSWKTRIIAIRDVEAGQGIGYNSTYITKSPSRIAILPVGYADGLNRQLSNHGRVIVRNDYAAMVGLVSMDLTAIDITGIPGVSIGDEVVLLGSTDERHVVTAWDHARISDTTPYEILCNISKRVPRKVVD
jgi:alanine racemase